MVMKGTLSRIGKSPIAIPQGVKVSFPPGQIKVDGPKGSLARSIPSSLSVKVDGGKVIVEVKESGREAKAVHGLIRAVISNMIAGVSQGFTRELVISGIGFKADVKGKVFVLSLGYTHPIEYPIPAGIEILSEKGNKITVKGADKELVGQVAATIRGFRVPDPYKEKGIKYLGEVIQRKVGKAASATQTRKS